MSSNPFFAHEVDTKHCLKCDSFHATHESRYTQQTPAENTSPSATNTENIQNKSQETNSMFAVDVNAPVRAMTRRIEKIFYRVTSHRLGRAMARKFADPDNVEAHESKDYGKVEDAMRNTTTREGAITPEPIKNHSLSDSEPTTTTSAVHADTEVENMTKHIEKIFLRATSQKLEEATAQKLTNPDIVIDYPDNAKASPNEDNVKVDDQIESNNTSCDRPITPEPKKDPSLLSCFEETPKILKSTRKPFLDEQILRETTNNADVSQVKLVFANKPIDRTSGRINRRRNNRDRLWYYSCCQCWEVGCLTWAGEMPLCVKEECGHRRCDECQEYREGTGMVNKVQEWKGKIVETNDGYADAGRKDGEGWKFSDY